MKTVIVLDTRPAQRLTACSERTQKGRRDRGPNIQSLCADRTVAFNHEKYEQGLCSTWK